MRKILAVLGAVLALGLGAWFLLQPASEVPPVPDPSGAGNGPIDIPGAAPDAPALPVWKDGTWTGTGRGKSGTITVDVTIRDGKIAAIDIVSTRDDKEYFNQAAALVPGEILASQSLEVDVASGATISSEGIIAAVADALDQAKN